jgi:hypothetical protein
MGRESTEPKGETMRGFVLVSSTPTLPPLFVIQCLMVSIHDIGKVYSDKGCILSKTRNIADQIGRRNQINPPSFRSDGSMATDTFLLVVGRGVVGDTKVLLSACVWTISPHGLVGRRHLRFAGYWFIISLPIQISCDIPISRQSLTTCEAD